MSSSIASQFTSLAFDAGAFRFQPYVTRAETISPYAFSLDSLCEGQTSYHLARFYSRAIHNANLEFDMLLSRAYKSIPLSVATAIAYDRLYHRSIPYAFSRRLKDRQKKEGQSEINGAPLKGRVLILDDVLGSGASVSEMIDIIRRNGSDPAGVAVAFDRTERGKKTNLSAAEQIRTSYGIPVIAIAALPDLFNLLRRRQDQKNIKHLRDYNNKYGTLNL